MGGWGGGGGSGGGTVSWGGSSKKGGGWGGGGTGGGSPKPKKSDPEHDLTSALVRAAKTIPSLSGHDQDRTKNQIRQSALGLSGDNLKRIAGALSASGQGELATRVLLTPHASNSGAAGFAHDTASVAGKGLEYASRPGQAVMSTIGQAWRTGGFRDPESLAKAFAGGLTGKRHDTASSIIQENTGYKLKGVGRFAADLGGSIATDPLTYASFGLSDLAKSGIRGATDVLGADRVAEVLQKGSKTLTAEENARLAAAAAKEGGALSKKTLEAFQKSSRGGLKVAHPTLTTKPVPFTGGRVSRPALELSAPRTIIPGPFSKLRAGKIIESAGTHPDAVRAQLAALGSEGERTVTKAAELEAQAKHLEAAGTDASALRSQVAELDTHAQDLAKQVEDLQSGAVRSATAAGNTLTNTPLGRAVEKAGSSKFAEALRGTFVRRGNIAHKYGQVAADTLANAKITANGVEHALLRDAHDTLAHAARTTGVTNDELRNVIGPALDVGGGGIAAVPDKLKPMYDALDTVRKNFTQAQLDAGVTVDEAIHTTDEYLARYRTVEEIKRQNPNKIDTYATPIGGEPTIEGRPSGQLNKRTENLDQNIQQINAEHQAEHGIPKFEDNPLPITLRRNAEAARDVANKHYIDQLTKVRDRAGNRLFAIGGSEKDIPKDWVSQDIRGVGVVHAPKEIMGEVTKVHELLVNDKALQGVVDGLDHWMQLWKSYATVPLPFGLGFHERNAMGNMFNNWLAGIRFTDPAYKKAFEIQRLASKGARKYGVATHYMNAEQRRIFDDATRHDVIGEGFFHQDITDAQHSPINTKFLKAPRDEKVSRLIGKKGERLHGTKGGALRPLNTHNILISSGQKFAAGIEGNARLAHFIVMEKRFGNAADASKSVRKYLFDYGDLTATEQNVFKRGMAFYTFTRKNLPLQVGALLHTPGKFSHLQAARVALADSSPAPKGLYPSYLPEVGGTPTPLAFGAALSTIPGSGFKANQQNVVAPDLPYLNAASAISPAAQLLSSLPGVNKIPGLPHNPEGVKGAVTDLATQTISGGAPGAVLNAIEGFGAGKDFFSGRNLTGNVAAPAWAKTIPGLVKERVLNGKKQPTITALQQFVVEGDMPLAGKVSSLAPQGDYEQEKGPRRRLSMFTGLRTYPLGPGASRGEAIRRLAALNQLLAEYRSRGIDIPSSRSSSSKSGGGW